MEIILFLKILDGNSDTKTAVHHDLNPPIIASRVRIIPHGIYPRTVCMRVELYGCRQNGKLLLLKKCMYHQ